jgi:hypothetical protein
MLSLRVIVLAPNVVCSGSVICFCVCLLFLHVVVVVGGGIKLFVIFFSLHPSTGTPSSKTLILRTGLFHLQRRLQAHGNGADRHCRSWKDLPFSILGVETFAR